MRKFSVFSFAGTLLVMGGICSFFIHNSNYDPMMIRFASAWTFVFAILSGFIAHVEHKTDAASQAPKFWGSAGWGVLILSVAFGLFAYSLSITTPG